MSQKKQIRDLLVDMTALVECELSIDSTMIKKKRIKNKVADEIFKRQDGVFQRWNVSIQSGADGVFVNWQFALSLSDECSIPSNANGYYGRLDDVDGLQRELLERYDTLGWFLIGDNLGSVGIGVRLIVNAITGPVKAHLDVVAKSLLKK